MSVIIYQDHIEILEEENAELQKEVMFLRRRLEYYKTIVEVDEGESRMALCLRRVLRTGINYTNWILTTL